MPGELAPEHVRASAAIPIFFPSVWVRTPRKAAGWYIDGGTRLNTPLKPALDLGADRIVVVGMDAVTEPEPDSPRKGEEPPDFGDGALHVLQGRLVDPMIEDVRMLGNTNVFFGNGSRAANAYRAARGKPPYRVVPYMFIAPERHGAIGSLATEVFKARYGSLTSLRGLRELAALRGTDFRLLNRLIGDDSPTHGELLSYLFFDRDFIDELIKMGQDDARRLAGGASGPHGSVAGRAARTLPAYSRRLVLRRERSSPLIAAGARPSGAASSSSTDLRRRTLFGVTSTHSSSWMNSSASSSVSARWAIGRSSTSAVEERMFVRCFSRIALTSRSPAREFSPTIIPS